MAETVNAALPRKKVSRKLGVYAGLWVFSVSLGFDIVGTLLLQTIFAGLTLWTVGSMIVSDAKAGGRGLRFSSALYLMCWFFWMLVTGLSPLWKTVVATAANAFMSRN